MSAGVAVSVARLHLLSASFPYVCCFDRFKKPLALLSMVGLVKLWDLFLKYKRRPDTNIYGTWYKVFSWALQICESNKTALSLGCLAIRLSREYWLRNLRVNGWFIVVTVDCVGHQNDPCRWH